MNEEKVQFEMDGIGSFRLIVNGVPGDWTHYQGIARSRDGHYLATSAYFRGKEEVFRVENITASVEFLP